MDLKQALVNFSKENIENLSSIYNWPINLAELPVEILVNGNNLYTKNIDLRFQLHSLYLKSNKFEDKYNLIKWYIYNWGGVRTNNQETITLYTTNSPKKLIERGSKGIASWSKALSIISPQEYAIYDARVAMSLNALQIINNIANPTYYPPLQSRNKIINNSKIQIQPIVKKWHKAKDQEFYQNYLNLLKDVASIVGNDASHHDIEMILFAYAEDLALSATRH